MNEWSIGRPLPPPLLTTVSGHAESVTAAVNKWGRLLATRGQPFPGVPRVAEINQGLICPYPMLAHHQAAAGRLEALQARPPCTLGLWSWLEACMPRGCRPWPRGAGVAGSFHSRLQRRGVPGSMGGTEACSPLLLIIAPLEEVSGWPPAGPLLEHWSSGAHQCCPSLLLNPPSPGGMHP